ncbi:MAG TPA: VWA domain-containing protein [Spirochaetota bacterium]|nr:VWA domain-containing protein [Spirochaetota bacterium]
MSVKRSLLFMYIFIFFAAPFSAVFPADRDFVKFEAAKEYFHKGMIYFNNMHYLAAADFFRRAVGEYPDYYSARDYLARSYKLSGFRESALAELYKVMDIEPDNLATKNRIESLLYRSSQYNSEDGGSYVLQASYDASKMKRFGFPDATDMTVDDDRNLYVVSFSTTRLVKIDPNGNGTDILRPGLTGSFYGIDYRDKMLAVTDFKQDRVFIITPAGKVLKEFGGSGNSEGLFHGPEGVCFDNKGFIYVVDAGNYRVQKFDTNGKFILSFGKRGEYEGEFEHPSDVVCLNDMLYVTDVTNRKVAVYDLYGNYVSDLKIDEVVSPRGITAKENRLVISDQKNGVILYDPVTGAKSVFNSWENDGSFRRAQNCFIDPDGFFYALDSVVNTIYVFSPVEKQYSNLEIEVTNVDVASFPVVAFYVNVRGRDGRPVYGLGRDNFKLVEDNSVITTTHSDYLKNRKSGASIVFAVDRSDSMRRSHNEVPWFADFILKSMRKNDSIEVLNFNDQVWKGSDFDWSRRRTLDVLGKEDYGIGKKTGSALFQAITDVSSRLDRRGVVLLTDGTLTPDSFVQYTPDIIIDYAREHYIPVYIISLKQPDPELARIANSTGGRVILPGDIDSLRRLYPDIKNSNEYRYILVYNTFKLPSFRGWWADVKLEVNYKGQTGTEWGGYFVP